MTIGGCAPVNMTICLSNKVYDINTVHYSVAAVKEAVWSEFVSRVVF